MAVRHAMLARQKRREHVLFLCANAKPINTVSDTVANTNLPESLDCIEDIVGDIYSIVLSGFEMGPSVAHMRCRMKTCT